MRLNNKYINIIRGNQLLKDSFWSLTGNVIGRGLALLAGILVARFLGKEIYGEYGIIRNTILTIGVFSTFGLGYTATKFIAEYKNDFPEKIPIFIKYANKITFGTSGFMAILLFLFSDFVAIEWLEAEQLGFPLKLLAILIIFNAITTTQIGILSGFGRFKEIAKINAVIGVATFILSVVLTYFYKLNGALVTLLIVQILNCLLNYIVVKKEIRPFKNSKEKDPQLMSRILQFSTPIALQEATYSITSWLSSLLLIRLGTFGDLGLYTAAIQWNSIVLFIPGILRNVVLSHLSEKNNDSLAHNKILKQTILINFGTTAILSIIVIIFSNVLAKSYGDSFQGLALIISLAVITTIFTSISNVYAQAFTSLNKNWMMLGIRMTRDIASIIGFVILTIYFNVNCVIALIMSTLLFSIIFLAFSAIVYKNIKKNEIFT